MKRSHTFEMLSTQLIRKKIQIMRTSLSIDRKQSSLCVSDMFCRYHGGDMNQ